MNNIKVGSIVAVPRAEYIDFPGGLWLDHFHIREHLFLVRTMPKNNGDFIGEDCRRFKTHININEVTRVIR